MNYKIFFSLLCIAISASIFAQTSVWQVEKNGNTMFIGGTIHILKASDYPLPAEYDSAFAQSQTIVFEADLKKLEDPEIAAEMMKRGMYADSTTIKDVLTDDTYTMLENELKKYGFPIAGVAKMKPSMIAVLLAGLHLQTMGMTEEGVDKHFFGKALAENKTLDFLESVDSQLDVLFSMGDGMENDFIRYTIEEMDNATEEMGKLDSDWRSGELINTNAALKEMRAEFPDLTESLLDDRNEDWMPAIYGYMETEEVEFVLFGNMHLAGETGILSLLKEQGYKVSQFKL